MPPRRPANGRHRKPKHGDGPAYVTAATLAAFAVSGLNVPGAIGAAREPHAASSAPSEQVQQARTVAAGQLRQTLVQQQEARATRMRTARATAVRRPLQEAAKDAPGEAAEAARPKWVLPVDHYRLTAGFGDYGLWASAHTGQDFAAPERHAGPRGGRRHDHLRRVRRAYGNKIVIQHPDGTVTWYAHLSSFIRTSGTGAGRRASSAGSAAPATRPVRTCTSRCDPAAATRSPPLTWLREHGLKP